MRVVVLLNRMIGLLGLHVKGVWFEGRCLDRRFERPRVRNPVHECGLEEKGASLASSGGAQRGDVCGGTDPTVTVSGAPESADG